MVRKLEEDVEVVWDIMTAPLAVFQIGSTVDERDAEDRQKGEMAPASWASIRRNIDQISWRRLALRRVDCCRPSLRAS